MTKVKTLENGLSESSQHQNPSKFRLRPDGYFERTNGLGWVVTGLFVVGDLAGGGLVALPTAMVQSGFYTGFVLVILMTFMFAYTSYLLGKSWVILQQRWPEYREKHCRKPYPAIAKRAFGKKMKNFVSACIDMNQFGTAVVYLLLSSKNIHDFVKTFFDSNISFCVIIVIVAVCLLPVTFLRSPQDFWAAVVIAMFTTTAAVILILIGATIDYPVCSSQHQMPEFRITNYFLALGTFLFAYGGHAAFPTIQHDMKRPHDFTKSTILAFSILFAMYIPVCLMGYLTYGNSLRESVINSVQTVWVQQAVNMFITVHCILTLTIVFNPINQEVEQFFQIPHHFCLKRVAIRTCVMASVVFVAETVPTFGPLLDLIGSSAMTLTSLIFPCMFFMVLETSTVEEKTEQKMKVPADIDRPKALDGKQLNSSSSSDQSIEQDVIFKVMERLNKPTLFCCTFIIAFGIVGGVASSLSALREISYAHFTIPCYVSAFITPEHNTIDSGGTINCCGPYQNITVFNHTSHFCSPPNLRFYN